MPDFIQPWQPWAPKGPQGPVTNVNGTVTVGGKTYADPIAVRARKKLFRNQPLSLSAPPGTSGVPQFGMPPAFGSGGLFGSGLTQGRTMADTQQGLARNGGAVPGSTDWMGELQQFAPPAMVAEPTIDPLTGVPIYGPAQSVDAGGGMVPDTSAQQFQTLPTGGQSSGSYGLPTGSTSPLDGGVGDPNNPNNGIDIRYNPKTDRDQNPALPYKEGGYNLSEVLNNNAGDYTTGYDYGRNTGGFLGEVGVDKTGGAMPQIAGYYAWNGKYYPIDIKKANYQNYAKRGGGGGRRPSSPAAGSGDITSATNWKF